MSTYTFYLYTGVLWLNFTFCCQLLSCDSGGQPTHCTCSLLYYAVYWCTLHARSLIKYVLSLSTPHFQNVYIWNTVWNRVFILNYVIWIENEWKVTDILLAIDISETQYGKKCHFIKLWYLKWKGVDRDRTIYLLGLNWTADFSWYSWSNTVF